ncbi:MAG: hypothetical protein IK024_04535 [Treponema sp.]|nr:hypothetical protein [Treponema sp.]
MKFEAVKSGTINFNIHYSVTDQSFVYDSTSEADIFFLISYLELGFDSDDNLLKSISGLSFQKSWKERKLYEPQGLEGTLLLKKECESGKIYRLDKNTIWDSYYDKTKGWFCLGEPVVKQTYKTIKVFNNAYVILDNFGEIKSLWIKPIFEK